jgi:hypothetical protein
MPITLRPNPDFPYHGDLHFARGAMHVSADTSYFELDHPAGASGGIPAMKASLAKWIAQWVDRVRKLPDGETAHLPFDYSDEYAGVISVSRMRIRRSGSG